MTLPSPTYAFSPIPSPQEKTNMLSPITPPIRKLDLQYILTPESTREPSRDPNPYEEINREQQLLFNDPRVAHQLVWFKRIQNTQPPTFYSALASIGIHILENGTSASQAEGLSSDFLSGTCEDLENWLINGTGDKLLLLRDPQWIRTRPQTTGSTVLQELQAISDKELLLEVQRLGKLLSETNSVQPMPVGDIIEHFATSDQSQAPINLLSLMCKMTGLSLGLLQNTATSLTELQPRHHQLFNPDSTPPQGSNPQKWSQSSWILNHACISRY